MGVELAACSEGSCSEEGGGGWIGEEAATDPAGGGFRGPLFNKTLRYTWRKIF